MKYVLIWGAVLEEKNLLLERFVFKFYKKLRMSFDQ